ncbi:hypothetical protein FDZ71_15180 [bacterium]|nr:MAG: hypothetical protein FDZ71_15180 [bacterium]
MKFLRKIFSAATPGAMPEIDLHGLKVPLALEKVEEAIREVSSKGGGDIRIICGKGKGSRGGMGVLREAVAGWLDAHGLEGKYRRDLESDGLDGAIILTVEGHFEGR